jgi:hypothetical protein
VIHTQERVQESISKLVLVKTGALLRPLVVKKDLQYRQAEAVQRRALRRGPEASEAQTAVVGAVVSARLPCLGVVVEHARQHVPGIGRMARQGNQGLKKHLWVGKHSR